MKDKDKHPKYLDHSESERLKKEGMERAARNRHIPLARGREIAIVLARARTDQECHAGLVQPFMVVEGLDMGNAAGSLFKESHWIFAHRWEENGMTTAHGREVRVWRLDETKLAENLRKKQKKQKNRHVPEQDS